MKTVSLKKVEEVVIITIKEATQPAKIEIATTDLLKIAINSPVQGGYSVSEMLQRIKLLDTVEKAEKENATEVQFEDADYQTLGALVKSTKWGIISRTIVEFVQEFDK